MYALCVAMLVSLEMAWTSSRSVRTSNFTGCRDPVNMSARIRKVMSRPRNRPVFMMLGLHGNASLVNPMDILVWLGDTSCPEQPRPTFGDEINVRALCPWFVDINRRLDRIPTVLPVASCKCSKCLSVPRNTYLAAASSCEPFFYNIQVLHRLDCRDGLYTYVYAWERIAIACVCAHKRIQKH